MSAFDAARFAALRRERGLSLGEPLVAVAETGSTNDDAMDAAKRGAPHGALFVADAQTRGRGRRGARWTSPSGENLLFSLLVRPDLAPERAGTLTLAVGLAVRAVAAARVSGAVRVKWPNDVLVGDAKLAGILLESQIEVGKVSALVIGVGLNVGMRALPAELRGIATSLALEGDPDARREDVLVELLAALERRLELHAQAGLAPVLAELRDADGLLGRKVKVDAVEGTAAGIADDGALVVRTSGGELRRVTAGSVELVQG